MILVEKEVELSAVEALIPEAKTRLESLSKALSKSDINTIVENLVENEPELAIALGSLNEELQLNEYIERHVSSKGEITRTKDRKTRARQAFQTTGLSKAARRQIARKAVKTRRAQPSTVMRAQRKRKRALSKRKALGLNN